MVVFIKCAVCCYNVAPRLNLSEEIIKYFELELNLKLNAYHTVRTAGGRLLGFNCLLMRGEHALSHERLLSKIFCVRFGIFHLKGLDNERSVFV